jgi:hypothetical protein
MNKYDKCHLIAPPCKRLRPCFGYSTGTETAAAFSEG